MGIAVKTANYTFRNFFPFVCAARLLTTSACVAVPTCVTSLFMKLYTYICNTFNCLALWRKEVSKQETPAAVAAAYCIALFITPSGLTFYWQLVVSKPGIQMSSFESVVSGIRFSLSPRHATFGEKMDVREVCQCCPSGDELLPLYTLTRTQPAFCSSSQLNGKRFLNLLIDKGMHYVCFAQFEWRSGYDQGLWDRLSIALILRE